MRLNRADVHNMNKTVRRVKKKFHALERCCRTLGWLRSRKTRNTSTKQPRIGPKFGWITFERLNELGTSFTPVSTPHFVDAPVGVTLGEHLFNKGFFGL